MEFFKSKPRSALRVQGAQSDQQTPEPVGVVGITKKDEGTEMEVEIRFQGKCVNVLIWNCQAPSSLALLLRGSVPAQCLVFPDILDFPFGEHTADTVPPPPLPHSEASPGLHLKQIPVKQIRVWRKLGHVRPRHGLLSIL